MRRFYLVSSVILFLLILILSLPQIGASCGWYPPLGTTTLPAFALLEASALGAIMGGLLILFWKAPKEGREDEGEGESDL